MKRRLIACAAALALALVALAGCDSEDKKSYDVTITWNVAGGQGTTCAGMLNGPSGSEQVDFETVAVTVYKADGDEDPIQQTVEVDCTAYEYTIPRLKRGNYFVELGAMAEYDDDYLPYYQAEGEISAPGKDGFDFTLLQGKGEISVTWSFENLAMCGPNEVTEVEISLYDGDETILCEDGEFLIEDLFWGEYSVSVDGLDESGDEIFSGDCEDNPFEVKPGQTYDAHVLLIEN
jgi:hypothetical protein